VHPAKIAFADNRLTSDRRRFYDHVNAVSENPDLAVGGVTWGWLHAAFRSIDRIGGSTYLNGIKTPVLIISAGSDRIVSEAAQQRAADLLPRGRLIRIQDARHEILKERDPLRDQFWQAFDSFAANTDRQ
jgi:lysophospholipase